MEAKSSCVVSSAGCCDREGMRNAQRNCLEGHWGWGKMRALVTGHATAACWGNSSRDVSYCETLMLPSGKSNISLGCQQDRYFPNGLWEAAAPRFLRWDCKQRCLSACYGAGAERGEEKGAAGCGQPESSRGTRGPAALGCCPRGEMRWAGEPSPSGIAEPNSRVVGCYMAGMVPVAANFSPWLFPTAGAGRGGWGLPSPKRTRISSIARRPAKSPGNCSP